MVRFLVEGSTIQDASCPFFVLRCSKGRGGVTAEGMGLGAGQTSLQRMERLHSRVFNSIACSLCIIERQFTSLLGRDVLGFEKTLDENGAAWWGSGPHLASTIR